MKKMLFSVMFLFILSCVDKNGEQSQNMGAGKEQPLIFLHYWSEEMGGGIEDMVQAFNKNNPGYSIKQMGFDHESFKISIQVMLKAGNPPDVFSYWAGARTESFIEKGYIASIETIWQKKGLDTLFSKVVKDACFYDGKPYVMPVTQHYVSFYYNRALFDKYGLEEPKNWSEFLIVCKTLKEAGETPIALGAQDFWPAQFWFDYLLLRTAGPVYRRKLMRGEAFYTDREVKRAFSLWKSLVDAGYFSKNPLENSWADASKMVGEKKAAMTLMGTWLVGYFDHTLKLKQGTDYDYFSFPVIDDDVPIVALGPIDGILLPKSPNAVKAKKIMTIFANPEVQRAMSEGSGSLSPAKAIQPAKDKLVQRNIHQELQQIPHWAFNYDLATPPKIAEKGLALFGSFLQKPESYEIGLQKMHEFCSSLEEK